MPAALAEETRKQSTLEIPWNGATCNFMKMFFRGNYEIASLGTCVVVLAVAAALFLFDASRLGILLLCLFFGALAVQLIFQALALNIASNSGHLSL
jgi:small-conductance mechanosensitive channel